MRLRRHTASGRRARPRRKTGGAHLKSDTDESSASFPDVSVHEPLSFGLRCKTMARRASCDLQQAAGVCVVCAQTPLRWLSFRRWQNTRACRARAALRWLWSAHATWKDTAPAGGLSSSVQEYSATCEL